MTKEAIKKALLNAICERCFPGAYAIDLPVMRMLEDEAEDYAAAVFAVLTAGHQTQDMSHD